MNGPSVNDRISPELERQIGRLLFEKMQPLLLEFDRDWHLVNLHGDAALFGFAPDNAATSVQQLQAVDAAAVKRELPLLLAELGNLAGVLRRARKSA